MESSLEAVREVFVVTLFFFLFLHVVVPRLKLENVRKIQRIQLKHIFLDITYNLHPVIVTYEVVVKICGDQMKSHKMADNIVRNLISRHFEC